MNDDPTVITLTSIPPRFASLGPTLDSLLAQDLPAPVELWLPERYERFPDWNGKLPEVPHGVRIRRCAVDHGPATKFLPALADRQGQAVDLLICDDDGCYAPDWHRRFKALRSARPGAALAAVGRHLPGIGPAPRARADRMPRMRRRPAEQTRAELARQGYGDGPPIALVAQSGHADLVGGWGGVMLRLAMLPTQALAGPGADCWPVDDVWLSGMLELAGTPIWIEASILPPARRNAGGIAALTNTEFDGRNRVALDAGCIAALRGNLGIWDARTLASPPAWRRWLARLLG